jgi:hypothetical protein
MAAADKASKKKPGWRAREKKTARCRPRRSAFVVPAESQPGEAPGGGSPTSTRRTTMELTLTANAIPATSSDARATGAPRSGGKARLWTGRIASGIAVAFLAFDTVIKLVQLAPAVEGTKQLGYPAGVVLPIGLMELACLVIYMIPRTAIIGAVLWTGYLGGAIATHVRMDSPLATHVLFPIYVAVLLWGGLYLRDRRVRALLGPRG